MDFGSFIDGIGGGEYADAVLAYDVDEGELSLFFDDFDAFVSRGREADDPGMFFLSSFLRLAYSRHDDYIRQGIPDDVFMATYSDISLWAGEYRRKTGRIGLDRIFWLHHHIRMELFRLGQLQFEIVRDQPQPPWPQFRDGARLLNVHIPKGSDLSLAEDSFSRALSFFREDRIVFLLHSWLASPQLQTLLDDGSRIKAFASLFTIVGEDDDRQAEERIFGCISDDPSAYTVTTTLSARAKRHLMDGGRILSGLGYLERP